MAAYLRNKLYTINN